MLRIGITGGIGSGKSTVAAIFEVLGIPVYYADKEAKALMNESAEIRTRVTALFGELAYDSDGNLNRSYIASQVFNNHERLSQLNAIVHPVTIQHSNEWMLLQTTPYAIKEAALIFESGMDKPQKLDKVIGVFAPKELRISRVMARDDMSRDDIIARMNNQMDENEKMRRCDYVITNDEEHPVIQQVLNLHEELCKFKSKK